MTVSLQTPASGTGPGRFTPPDSHTQLDNPADGNLYAYAADSPTNYTDPTGQSACGNWLFGLGVLAGGILLRALGIGLAVVAPEFSPASYYLGAAGLGLALAGAIQLGLRRRASSRTGLARAGFLHLPTG